MPFCTRCGQEVGDGVSYCSDCGKMLGAGVTSEDSKIPAKGKGRRALEVLGVILLVISILMARGIVKSIFSERSAVTLTASERAYRKTLLEHHQRIVEYTDQSWSDVLELEQRYHKGEASFEETRAKFIEYYDGFIALAEAGITTDGFFGSASLSPPQSMLHIQAEYNLAMAHYVGAAEFHKEVVQEAEHDVYDETLVRKELFAIEIHEKGNEHLSRARQLLDEFVESRRR